VTLEMTNLQEINKGLGHSGGDLAIQSFATVLQDAAGRTCFIGRNGGNKFVVIFRDCTDARLERFLDKVAALTEERNTSRDVPIKYSAGTAFNEGDSVGTVTELVALSDRRAWQAHQK
jgi:diguanylate cyclase (GGDEF)-like protein